MALSFLTMFFTRDAGFDIKRLWISVVFFSAGLPGFFNATKDIRWMNGFGNISYPVYLTHPMAVIFVGPAVYFWFASHGVAGQVQYFWSWLL
jgi:peptidoglycan/LPS O-acetylase OafA/YrhL